jgi:hypothetical protein
MGLSDWWKHALNDERLPVRNTMRSVYLKDIDCCTTDRCTANERRSVPPEMSGPFMTSGIKQPDSTARLWIDAAEIGSFVMIVGKARKCQVAHHRCAAMLLGDNMVDLMIDRREFLWQLAEFAAVPRSAANLASQALTRSHSGGGPLALEDTTSLRMKNAQ